jgi:protein TonB
MIWVGLWGTVLLASQPTAPRPLADPRLWIQPGDYPHVERPQAVNVVRVRLTVDKRGRVANCAILRSAGAEFDQVTCRIFRSRGRFCPARNSAGRPAVGHVRMTVSWRLPES